MALSKMGAGVRIRHEAEHRKADGTLIVRLTSVEAPILTCLKPICVYRYLVNVLRYILLSWYHKYRIVCAQKARHIDIPERYRSGYENPHTIWQLVTDILKLRRLTRKI